MVSILIRVVCGVIVNLNRVNTFHIMHFYLSQMPDIITQFDVLPSWDININVYFGIRFCSKTSRGKHS